ncbi:hypothetical protein [Paenibacillus sp. 1P07SE]|uniref:hypothetical protein n=1 Tax=Paenibacillus sp. 1P07SE TaxID=3132209 RepID=UPI0039A6812C
MRTTGRQPRRVLVGTDWWTDCDDVVAMRVLLWAERQQMIEVLGIGINACMETSVASLDAFLTAEGRPGMPLGLDRAATDFGGTPPYQQAMLAHPHERTNSDVEDAVRLYRRMLASAQMKLEIIEIGYPQVLAELLDSPADELSPLTGRELVAERVTKLWMMAGNWQSDEGGSENNFARNRRSRRAGSLVCRDWPTPVTFLGWETASDILTGGSITDPDDMVARALRDHGSAGGRSSWDPMLVLLACIGDEAAAGYQTVTGAAAVDAESGINTFRSRADGRHAYVVKVRPDEVYREEIDRIVTGHREG